MTLQNPIYILASNEAAGHSPSSVWAGGGGSGGKPASAAVFPTWGYKATITTPKQNFVDISPLGDTYSVADLDEQRAEMSKTTTNRYWEPGSRGVHVYKVDVGMGKRFSTEPGRVDKTADIVNFKVKNEEWNAAGNPLAWAIYNDESATAPEYDYNEELANLFTAEGASACGDPKTWLNEVDRLYYTITSSKGAQEVSQRKPKQLVQGLFADGNGRIIVDHFREFTWSENDTGIVWTEDPYIQALGSRIGLVACDAVFAMAALEYGDGKTAEEMANKIYAWITSDYDLDNMAILMVESTSGINANGNVSGTCDFLTLLDHIALSYGSQEIFMSEWPEECWGDTNKAFTWSTNGAMLPTGWKGPFRQGIWGYPNGGVFVDTDSGGGYYHGRGYLRTLYPYWVEGVYGYFLNWTYAAGGSNSNSNKNKNSMGSFTWQLNPSGVRDKTPDTEVNASSTIYNLNISQDGYNDNNYMTDWVPAVRQDTVDGNKLRIRIYHISENLAEDQQTTEYTKNSELLGNKLPSSSFVCIVSLLTFFYKLFNQMLYIFGTCAADCASACDFLHFF